MATPQRNQRRLPPSRNPPPDHPGGDNPGPGGLGRVLRWLVPALVLGAVVYFVLDAFPSANLTNAELASATALAAVVAAIVLRQGDWGGAGKVLKAAAVWIGLAAVLLVGYSFREELGFVKNRVLAEIDPSSVRTTGEREITVRASADGHFYLRAKGWLGAERPVFMFVGRVAVEKNLEAFLALDLPGTKFVVGDGPQLEQLRGKYPKTQFTGYRAGDELAATLAEADVFVFPSLTDTFGLVLLEALASGVPVAAFPVTGPIDVILDNNVGALDFDLRRAALDALGKSPAACRAYALGYSWRRCAEIFLGHLRPFERVLPDYQRKISTPSFTS